MDRPFYRRGCPFPDWSIRPYIHPPEVIQRLTCHSFSNFQVEFSVVLIVLGDSSEKLATNPQVKKVYLGGA